MRGGHTKQKTSSKRGESIGSNDGPSSTTRRSKAIRASKEEGDKKMPKPIETKEGLGRRRRTSSRSRSGDDSVSKDKGVSKTRSSDAGSCTTPRSANKRILTTPKKAELDKSKPVKKKDTDKNTETPTKRKTLRRDSVTHTETGAAPKARTPSTDTSKDKRSLRGANGRQSHHAVASNKDMASSALKDIRQASALSESKIKINEASISKIGSVSSKSTSAEHTRSDSETESERELSGEYVYVDTDESEVKSGVTELDKSVASMSGEVNQGEVDKKDTETHVTVDVNFDKTSEFGKESTNACLTNQNENLSETKNFSTGKANDENDQTASHELIDGEAVSGGDVGLHVEETETKSELNKLDPVLPDQCKNDSEFLSTDLELCLDESSEKEPSEPSNKSTSEAVIINDDIPSAATKCGMLDDNDIGLPQSENVNKNKFQKAEESVGSINEEGVLGSDVIASAEESSPDALSGCVKSQNTSVPNNEEGSLDHKDDGSFWLDEHGLVIDDDHCVDGASDERQNVSEHPAGIDGDSCSTGSMNNDTQKVPQQGRSKHRGPIRPGLDFTQGSRLEACDFMGKWYPAKVIDVDWKEQEVLIHFERWSSRFDEWVSTDSPRLRAITRTSARKEFRQKLQEVFKIGETVLARWADGKMYPAKVAAFNSNGSFQVVFHDDGIQKTVKYTNITKLKEDQALQLSLDQVTAPLMTEKKKNLESGPSRSSSREKKPSKRTLSPDDSPPQAAKSPKILRKMEHVTDIKDLKQKRIQKNDRRPSTSGVSVRRKKLLVGGIFQAKRPQTDVESPKRSLASQRLQSTGRSKTTKRSKSDFDVDSQIIDGEAKVEVTESVESPLKLTEECMAEDELDENGLPRKKKFIGGHAPKEFIIEEDHNHFKCPIDDCGKGFRKETLLASHMKHYHKADNKAYGRRRIESDTSRGEGVSIKTTTSFADEVKEGGMASEKHEIEKRNVRNKVPEMQKKTEFISEEYTELSTEIKEKEIKKIRTKPEPVPVKPRESGKKGLPGSRQKTEEAKQTQRRRTPSGTNKGEKRKVEPKAKAGPSHSLKEEDKDSAKSRSIGMKDKAKRRKVAGAAVKGVEKPAPESTEDESSFRTQALNEECASPVKDPSLNVVTSPKGYDNSTGVQNVRRPGKRRKPVLAASQPKEEPSSFVGDYGVLRSPSELAEFPPYEDDDDGGREEVVNCICRIREEDGLMMQCENCMAWQHGACFNIEEEEKVPNKYICFACQSPRGQRESYRYWYDQDWWKVGEMACFNFLPKDHHPQSLSGSMYKAHALANSMYGVDHALRSLHVKLEIAKNLDNQDIHLWNQPWTDGIQNVSNLAVVQTPGGCISKQKGELSYCDHSYSAPNRNMSGKQEAISSDKLSSELTMNGTGGVSSMPINPTLIKSDNLPESCANATTTHLENTTMAHAESVPVSQNENETATHTEDVTVPDDKKADQPTGCNGDHMKPNELPRESSVITSSAELATLDCQVAPEKETDLSQNVDDKSLLLKIKEEVPPVSGLCNDASSTPTPKNGGIVVKEESTQDCLINTPTKLEKMDSKPVSLDSPVKIEPPSPSNPLSASVVENVDSITCQLNLLDHIEQMQEELDRRLEEISQHVENLEMEYDIPAAASHRETLADLPSTKRLVRLMQFNLSKVQRLAALN